MNEIIAWMQSVVGSDIPVILAHQNASVPDGDYISVSFVTQTDTPDKITERSRDGDSIQYHMEGSDILSVDVKAFSASGLSLLRSIRLAARDPHAQSVPALFDCGPVYGPAFFNDTHYRSQYHCEFQFRVSSSYDTTGARVQSVDLDGEVDSLQAAVEATFD